jgi:conjugal transfer pilin signal peptidase TrbI
MPMKKKILIICSALSFLTLTTFAFVSLYLHGYRLNLSDSLPGVVYLATPLLKDEAVVRGDFVLIDISRLSNPVIELGIGRGYVSRKRAMLKEVGAVPFDVLTLGNNSLYINGNPAPMIVSPSDSRGNALSPYPTPIVLSPDHYWLISAPYLGFDSRYFGPINREAFTHKARRIF